MTQEFRLGEMLPLLILPGHKAGVWRVRYIARIDGEGWGRLTAKAGGIPDSDSVLKAMPMGQA